MTDRNILIRTFVGDYHAYAVRWALRKKNIPSSIWESSEFPVDQNLTLNINKKNVLDYKMKTATNAPSINDFNVIWNRRTGRQRFSKNLHRGDIRFARSETLDFLNGYIALLGKNAFWINPVSLAAHITNKILQLYYDDICGLIIPDTIFTNDPVEVNSFLKQYNGNIIYKPFNTNIWSMPYKLNSYSAINYTSMVCENDFDDPERISMAPGIYQQKIEKRYELRITIMGQHVVAVRIDSQSLESASMDWRHDQLTIPLEINILQMDIKEKCLNFMRKSGIVFGCIDMIVTNNNEYVFLEINEMGQFLWIESNNDKIHLLDDSTDFLISGDSKFVKNHYKKNSVTIQEFDKSDEGNFLQSFMNAEKVKYQYSRFDSDDENYEYMNGIWSI